MTVYRDDFITNRHAAIDSLSWPLVPVTKSHGEGSRGGHIIGRTNSGKPIYARGSAHYAKLSDNYKAIDTGTHPASRRNNLKMVRASFPDYSKQDHIDAADRHGGIAQVARRTYKGMTQTNDLFHRKMAKYQEHSSIAGGHDDAAQSMDDSVKKSQRGEGSRGGHIIGHTKSGDPIYAHSSVKLHQIKPLADGGQYTLAHVHPKSLDEDNPTAINAEHAYAGDDIPLANGHSIRTVVALESHGGSSGDGYHEPRSYDGPEFNITHHIVDKDGSPVQGATRSKDLEIALEDHAIAMHNKLVEDYESGDSPHIPPQQEYERD